MNRSENSSFKVRRGMKSRKNCFIEAVKKIFSREATKSEGNIIPGEKSVTTLFRRAYFFN